MDCLHFKNRLGSQFVYNWAVWNSSYFFTPTRKQREIVCSTQGRTREKPECAVNSTDAN